jgi:hypothetical protein
MTSSSCQVYRQLKKVWQHDQMQCYMQQDLDILNQHGNLRQQHRYQDLLQLQEEQDLKQLDIQTYLKNYKLIFHRLLLCAKVVQVFNLLEEHH